ncbi:hypothetical protein [Flavobacterium sp. 1355]|uniref:hypothetical protein n=1 Tax=Flavobacterium sp. 1355 TaxID=2806571 RepID=UPI001AEA1B67|nr:hypothetical protein [Flavobacterium sp. 1355]MBP1223805.1 hypothetical protein [Flavobacterium sp. 1355]
MRKLVVFLVFMNFLLLGGGQYLNAENQHNPHHNFERRHHVKYTHQEQGNSIIEDAADLDLDEEFLGNDLKNGLTSKFFAANYSLIDNLYLTLSRQISVNSYSLFEILGPSCGQSNPIYITQRVLRI